MNHILGKRNITRAVLKRLTVSILGKPVVQQFLVFSPRSASQHFVFAIEMAALVIRVALVVLICFGSSVVGKCPCEDEALCEPISRPPGREFFMFSSKPNVWKKYDWAKVTTIALFRPWDDELMCEAHKKVRNKLIIITCDNSLISFFFS